MNWTNADRLWEEIIHRKVQTDGEWYTSSIAALVKSWSWTCKNNQRWAKAREVAFRALKIAERAYDLGSLAFGGHLLILETLRKLFTASILCLKIMGHFIIHLIPCGRDLSRRFGTQCISMDGGICAMVIWELLDPSMGYTVSDLRGLNTRWKSAL